MESSQITTMKRPEEFTAICRNSEHTTNEDPADTAVFKSVRANYSDEQSGYKQQHTEESVVDVLS